MPLVQLLTNLQNFPYYYGGTGNFIQKSIAYGNDQPGGSSNEPYVQFPLPDVASRPLLNYYQSNRASLDFPIRGAGPNIIRTGLPAPLAAKYDLERISKFLKTEPKGPVFITKQIGLQLSNPKLEVGEQANLDPGRSTARFFGVIENTRIYNGGLNTLAQVAAQGSGVHGDRHGTTPYNPTKSTYVEVVKSYNEKNNGSENRLVTLLHSKKLEAGSTSQPSTIPGNLNNLIRLGIPRDNENLLFQYPSGPGSFYGIGLTTIPRYLNNNELYNHNPVTSLYADSTGTPTTLLDILNTTKEIYAQDRPGYVQYTELTRGIGNRMVSLLQTKLLETKQGADKLYIPTDPLLLFTYPGGPGAVKAGDTTAIRRSVDTRGLYKDITPSPLYNRGDQFIQFADILKDTSVDVFAQNKSGYVPQNDSSIATPPAEDDSRLAILSKQLISQDPSGIGRSPIPNAPPTLVAPTTDPINILYSYLKNGVLQPLKRSVNTDLNTNSVALNNAKAYNYQQFNNIAKDASFRDTGGFIDFRDPTNDVYNNGKTGDMVYRIGVSDPGGNDLATKTDKVSMAPIGADYGVNNKQEKVGDLIKFRFTALEYDGQGKVPILFRAYISTFQDSHTGEITPFKYVGRGESFYVYTGFTRTISFNFKIAAQSRDEMIPLYKKYNYLLSQVYPDYNSSGFMRSPIVELTVGDYLYKQPGFITSLNASVAETSAWDINLDGDLFEAPQVVDISCQFTPIHDFLPRRNVNKVITSPLAFKTKQIQG